MVIIVLLKLAVFTHLAQAGKEVSVGLLASKRAVRKSNIGVWGRTGGLDPVQLWGGRVNLDRTGSYLSNVMKDSPQPVK